MRSKWNIFVKHFLQIVILFMFTDKKSDRLKKLSPYGVDVEYFHSRD